MRTKLLFLLSSALLLSLSANAQFGSGIVYDPSNFAQSIKNTTQQIVQTSSIVGNTLDNFKETVKIYEQGKQYYDALKSVNNLLRDGRKVQKTLLMLGDISEIYISNYGKMLVDENFEPEELEAIGVGFTQILRESTDLITDLQAVINPSTLSMSDKERMEIIEDIYQAMSEQRAFADYYARKFIGVSYVRSMNVNSMERVQSLYGSQSERYW